MASFFSAVRAIPSLINGAYHNTRAKPLGQLQHLIKSWLPVFIACRVENTLAPATFRPASIFCHSVESSINGRFTLGLMSHSAETLQTPELLNSCFRRRATQATQPLGRALSRQGRAAEGATGARRKFSTPSPVRRLVKRPGRSSPLRGILSPAAASATSIHRSTSTSTKSSARLTPTAHGSERGEVASLQKSEEKRSLRE